MALEPFSRDHNTGLLIGRGLSLGREGAVEGFLAAWNEELSDHFDEEERLLGPLASPELAQRLADEHRDIRNLIPGLPGTASRLGEALELHIRWEERTLFPAIEVSATEEQLLALRKETDEVEMRRWPASPKRQELVERRWRGTPEG